MPTPTPTPGQDQTPTPNPPEDEHGGGTPAAAPARTFTQVDLDRIVSDRLAREREKYNAALAKVGIEGGIDAVDTHIQSQDEAQKNSLAEQKKYKELWETEKAEKSRLMAEKDAKLSELSKAREADHIERELMKAAVQSVAPDQVAALCREKVRFDPETKSVYVVDELGNRMTDGQGGYLTVGGYVGLFLQKNPHFAPAAGGQGAGSGAPNRPPSAGAQSGGALGFDHARIAGGDLSYTLENREAVKRAIQSGQLS